MAVQILHDDGPVWVVHVSDSATEVVDVSALTGIAALDKVVCLKALLSSNGLTSVSLAWDASADIEFATIGDEGSQVFDWHDVGGVRNNAGAGVTGDINVVAVGTGTLSATLWLRRQA